MKELNYPFDPIYILKKRKYIKNKLSEQSDKFIEKKIAILGGSTTSDIKQILEIFLLNYGIKPSFYESEYNKFYEDGAFENKNLEEFAPEIIYICTNIKNIPDFPKIADTKEIIEQKLDYAFQKYKSIWHNIQNRYHCPIIQNNVEYPYFRLLGNKDASDIHGIVNFVTRINSKIYEFAQNNDNFYICDINYISSSYGLDKWSNPYYWHMYKYAVAMPAVPLLSYNVANIIKSIFGKNKKVLNLDLDNTLWGGIIGDDGADNIEIGKDTSLAQAYSEFQEYIKSQKQLGILLTINSKNDEKNAIAGLSRPDSILKKEDFVNIKANWNPKTQNIIETAQELNILPESFVFVDDNPAERELVNKQIPEVSTPEITNIENYIQIIDKSGFFEVTTLSKDSLNRNEMYIANAKRLNFQTNFLNYDDYLKHLEMKCEIQNFIPVYMSRVTELINKSNQFNLTAKRYTQPEIEEIAKSENYITLYGKLSDKFGDNGVISVVAGKIPDKNKDELHIDLWLMSCRVLKRNVEFAMMDELVKAAKAKNIKKIIGYYNSSGKNTMVREFYKTLDFEQVQSGDNGNTIWQYCIPDNYKNMNNIIQIIS